MATAVLVVPFLAAERLNHNVQTPPPANMRQAATASARASIGLARRHGWVRMEKIPPISRADAGQATTGGCISRLGKKVRIGRQPGVQLDSQQILVSGVGVIPQQRVQGAHLGFSS